MFCFFSELLYWVFFSFVAPIGVNMVMAELSYNLSIFCMMLISFVPRQWTYVRIKKTKVVTSFPCQWDVVFGFQRSYVAKFDIRCYSRIYHFVGRLLSPMEVISQLLLCPSVKNLREIWSG